MAKYRAGGLIYLAGHLLQPGVEFESDAVPGKSWMPLDDAAHAAHRARFPKAAEPASPDHPVVVRARETLQKAVEPPPEPTREPTREESRALADAGVMPTREYVERVTEEAAKPPQVEIPDGWEDLPSEEVVALSRELGAPKNNRYTQAIAYIEKVIAERRKET